MNSKSQGGEIDAKITPSGDEDYYNNYVYKKGWTYKGENLGNPLLTSNKYARRDLPAMYCLKGHDLLRLGRPREAAAAFDEALKLQPRSRMALDGKARALAALASLEVEKY